MALFYSMFGGGPSRWLDCEIVAVATWPFEPIAALNAGHEKTAENGEKLRSM